MAKLAKYQWLLDRVGYDGEGCLLWPFAKDHEGRGMVGVGNKKIRKAHRIMCELVNGPPPSSAHQAAHECGNGNIGCVHPKHLSWKTLSGNMRDRIRHGHPPGNPGGPKTLFSPEQIEELKGDIAAGMTVMDMSKKFRRSRSVIQFWKKKFRENPNPVIRSARAA